MPSRILMQDAGFIRDINNLLKPLNIQTAVLEDFIALAVRAATADYEVDKNGYIGMARQHVVMYGDEVLNVFDPIFLCMVNYYRHTFDSYGWLGLGDSFTIKFGGFVGYTTDYILIGG